MGGKECPHCKSCVIKPPELKMNRVRCMVCRGPDFCWKCSDSWASSTNDKCGNPECDLSKDRKTLIESCGSKTVDGIANCPVYRVCPNCSIIVEHIEACRHMKC